MGIVHNSLSSLVPKKIRKYDVIKSHPIYLIMKFSQFTVCFSMFFFSVQTIDCTVCAIKYNEKFDTCVIWILFDINLKLNHKRLSIQTVNILSRQFLTIYSDGLMPSSYFKLIYTCMCSYVCVLHIFY